MADSSLLPDLLDRASNVFGVASSLSREFEQDFRSQGPVIMSGQESPKSRHLERINEFIDVVLDLRDSIQKPLDGFVIVAEQLRLAGKYAKLLRDNNNWEILELWPQLNQVAHDGYIAVKETRQLCRLDDPFAFIDEPPADNTAEVALTLLDRFPAKEAGHVAFLEMVRDEVHGAAEAKRQQLAREYTNDTLTSMVGGIKWAEAEQRISMLSDLPADVVEEVAPILRRELTIGTVEQIDELLLSAMRTLRDGLESLGDVELSSEGDKPLLADNAPQQQTDKDSSRYTVGQLISDLKCQESYASQAAAQQAKVTGACEAGTKNAFYQRTAINLGNQSHAKGAEIACQPGVERLGLVCDAEPDGEWGSRWVEQRRAACCLAGNVTKATVDAMAVTEFAELLAPGERTDVENSRSPSEADIDDATAKQEAETPVETEFRDYAPAKDIRTKHTPDGVVLDHRKLKRFLDQHHSTIRTTQPLGRDGKPRKNRLLVHLADWHKHQDALKEWYTADDDSTGTATESEIAKRTAAIPKRKRSGK